MCWQKWLCHRAYCWRGADLTSSLLTLLGQIGILDSVEQYGSLKDGTAISEKIRDDMWAARKANERIIRLLGVCPMRGSICEGNEAAAATQLAYSDDQDIWRGLTSDSIDHQLR